MISKPKPEPDVEIPVANDFLLVKYGADEVYTQNVSIPQAAPR